MKSDSPRSSESATRMLVCSVIGGSGHARGADGSSGVGEDDADAQRSQQRALARHVGAGDEQEAARRPELDVVGDPHGVGEQRMRERVGLEAVMPWGDLGKRPGRMVVRERGQRGQRFHSAHRGQPLGDVTAMRVAPALHGPPHVQFPERQRLNGEIEPRGQTEVRQRDELFETPKRPFAPDRPSRAWLVRP